MSFFLFFVSLLFLALGLVFIYWPAGIVKFNKIVRERIFNDNRVLLERRKKGFFFMLLFLIFTYWGYQNFCSAPAAIIAKLVPPERLLYLSFHHLHLKEYEASKRLCETVIKREPNNSEAYYQLAAAEFLTGNNDAASSSWKKAAAIDPNSEKADRLIKLIVRQKNLPSEDIAAFR